MTMVMFDDSVSASKAKATLLALLDEVASSGRSITVTKHGKPVADIVPHQHGEPYDLVGTTREVPGADPFDGPAVPEEEFTWDSGNILGKPDANS